MLARLRAARAFAHEIVEVLASASRVAPSHVTGRVADAPLTIAREAGRPRELTIILLYYRIVSI